MDPSVNLARAAWEENWREIWGLQIEVLTTCHRVFSLATKRAEEMGTVEALQTCFEARTCHAVSTSLPAVPMRVAGRRCAGEPLRPRRLTC